MKDHEPESEFEDFRTGIRAWSAVEYGGIQVNIEPGRSPAPWKRLLLVPVAIVAAFALLLFPRMANHSHQRADARDVEILGQMDQRLSETVPSPLEPLTLIDGDSTR